MSAYVGLITPRFRLDIAIRLGNDGEVALFGPQSFDEYIAVLDRVRGDRERRQRASP